MFQPHSLQFLTLVWVHTACSTPYSSPMEPALPWTPWDPSPASSRCEHPDRWLGLTTAASLWSGQNRAQALLHVGRWASPALPPSSADRFQIFTWGSAPSPLGSSIRFPPIPIHFRDCCPSHISDTDPLLCTFPLCLSGDPRNEIQTAVNAALCLPAPPKGVTSPRLPALHGSVLLPWPRCKTRWEERAWWLPFFLSAQRFLFFHLPVGEASGVEDTCDI